MPKDCSYYNDKVVQFDDNVVHLESYAEAGMCARVLNVFGENLDSEDENEHVYIFTFDFSEFDSHNTQFETSNYFDETGNPCLTAREAGMYEPVEKFYISPVDIDSFDVYFKIVDANASALIDAFNKSGSTNYVEWLESKITL